MESIQYGKLFQVSIQSCALWPAMVSMGNPSMAAILALAYKRASSYSLAAAMTVAVDICEFVADVLSILTRFGGLDRSSHLNPLTLHLDLTSTTSCHNWCHSQNAAPRRRFVSTS